MRSAVVLLVAAMLCVSVAGAWSYPTWDGGSGLVTLQTAEVAPTGSVDLALDYQKTMGIKVYPARAAIGIAENAELWVGYARVSGDESGRQYNAGAKYLLLTEPRNIVSLAVGAGMGKMENGESVNVSEFFVAATKNLSMKQVSFLPVAAKATAGLLHMRAGDPYDESTTKPYVGVEFSGKCGGTLGLEYRFKDSSIESDPVFSAVVRYPMGDKANPIWLQLGTTNGGLGTGGDEHKIFFGVGYRFGGWATGGRAESDTRSGPWGY